MIFLHDLTMEIDFHSNKLTVNIGFFSPSKSVSMNKTMQKIQGQFSQNLFTIFGYIRNY